MICNVKDISNYQRITIVGSGGSGKSTLSRKLAAITGLPITHLDMEFWRPNWERTPHDEWTEKQMGLIEHKQWIIDGNYNSTLELRFAAADLVIFLDISRFVCLLRVLKRRNKKRTDFPSFLEEKLDWEFLKWIWNFPKNGKDTILRLHKEYPNKPFVVIRNKKELKKILEEFR